MPTPILHVELAFNVPPLTSHPETVWTDVTPWVAAWPGVSHQIRRGRNHERDEFEAGTAIVVLNNRDRRFDPDNSSAPAPYYPNIQPMVKIRIGGEWEGTIYWLFSGYVESWQPEYPGGTISTVTIECVDAFKYFGMTRVRTYENRPQEYVNGRIVAALDAIGWSEDDRFIETADVVVMGMLIDDSALGVIQSSTQAERGQFYIDRLGNAIFESRTNRDGRVSIAIFDDEPTGSKLPYSSITTRLDDSQLWNQVFASRIGGIQQHGYNLDSQTEYFVRTLTMPDLPWVDDATALEAARFMVARYGVPHTRVSEMTIDPGPGDAWSSILPREISDRITVRRTTLVDGDVLQLDAYIEAIEWQYSHGSMICTWQLSPVFNPGPADGALSDETDWRLVTPANMWAEWTSDPVRPLAYRIDGNTVRMRGWADGTATAGVTIYQLPMGYRPPMLMKFPVVVDSGGVPSVATVYVQPTGEVQVSGSVRTNIDLTPIQFRVT
jgi:hypothetical protein